MKSISTLFRSALFTKNTFLKVFLLASCCATVSNYDRFFIFVNGVSHLSKCKSDLKQKPKMEDAGAEVFQLSHGAIHLDPRSGGGGVDIERAVLKLLVLNSNPAPSINVNPKLLNLRMGRC